MNRFRRRLLLGLALFPVLGRALETTPRAAEGPFYPTEKMRFDDVDNNLVKITDRVEKAGGEVIELTGRVLKADGTPIVGAKVEIWQCDVTGRYLHSGDASSRNRDPDFQGFGVDVSDDQGVYRFQTIKPVPYPGRTPHIHVKVWIDGVDRLTTQFYLADHPGNDRDWLYRNTPENLRESITMRFSDKGEIPQTNLDIVV